MHNPAGKDPEDGAGVSDKRRSGGILEFEETLTYMLNVPKKVRQDRTDVYVYFRLLETGETIGTGGNTSVSKGGSGGYQLRGWYCHKINEPTGKVIVGTFDENFFRLPEKTPPVDTKDFLSLPTSIEFSIEEMTGTTTRRKME